MTLRTSIFTLLLAAGLLLLVPRGGQAAPDRGLSARIVTWNARDLLSVEQVRQRAAQLRRAAETTLPDVLVLQEVTSDAVVAELRAVMQLDGYAIAWSDFDQDDGTDRNCFEVAVLSRYPLGRVVEFDPTPDNEPVEGDPEERPLPVLPDLPAENPARGYLWVEIPALDITLSVVHLKSSRGARGRRDADNASKREYVAGAVTANIAEAMRQMPRSYAHLVLGDLNVGHTDDSKNGRDLGDDCYSDCADRDGYDDTHALLRDGLISGVRMRNLATGQRRLIDAIYVTETAAGRFSPAETTGTGYGSDHAPLFTDLEMP